MKKNMIQQVMTSPGNIIFRKVPIPELSPNEVLVKIHMIGICGSDIHVYHGEHPFTSYPITQGHEVSGEIAEIGKNVTGFAIGQKVTIEPQIFCGHCHPCTHGKYNLCEHLKVIGFQSTGTASTFFAVDSDKVTAFPENISFEEGALIEPLAVSVHAVKRAGDLKGSNIIVIGAGPIGNLVAQTAKATGANVLITDISNYRLNLAKDCGIDFAINTKNNELESEIIKAFGKDKADIIYDCAGNNISINQAIHCARKGSTIILVAVFSEIANVDLAVLNDHEITLNTTMMYRHEDYLFAIDLLKERKVSLKKLVSKTFSFGDYKKAYEFIDDNRETTMKILINVQDDSKIII